MHKSDLVYIEHILDCIKKIKKFKTLLSDKKQGAPTKFIYYLVTPACLNGLSTAGR